MVRFTRLPLMQHNILDYNNYHPLMKLQEGNYRPKRSWCKVMFLHLSVSHSVHKGCLAGILGQTPPQSDTPWQMATAADGLHPTRMHSCFFSHVILPTGKVPCDCYRSCIGPFVQGLSVLYFSLLCTRTLWPWPYSYRDPRHGHVQTCSTLTSLYRDLPRHVQTFFVWLANGWLASYWNAF